MKRTRQSRRSNLAVTRLEDRTVPASIQTDLANFAPDRVLVAYTDTADHTVDLKQLPITAAVESLGLGTYAVTLTAGISPLSAVTVYAGQPGVVAATPDYDLTVERTPNDTSFGTQWGLNNTGQSGGAADADIDATEAWDLQTGTRSTIVAVIDTGVDYNHPDLYANIWVNSSEIPGDSVDNDGNGYVDDVHGYDFANRDGNPTDDNGHGTHVAGIIGAVGNNGRGVAGVNWNTRIMALKFLNASGSGSTSNAILALNYAVTMGAAISNNSWGGGGSSLALSTAIGNARNTGHIFVAAAGNDGDNNDSIAFYPGNYTTQLDNVVAVAAVDRNGSLASFSNYGGTRVTLAAPGVSILSTLPNNAYGTYSGTSMATPFVAGALALLKDQNPTWSHTQLIARLKSSVDPLSSLAGKVSTGGRLNVARMLNVAVPPNVPPPPAFVSGPKGLAATFGGPNATAFSVVRLTFDKPVLASSFTTADVALAGPAGSIAATGVSPAPGTNNTQFDITFAQQTAVGAYTITVGPAITDTAGHTMNQDGDTTNGESADRFTAAASLADSRYTFAAANLPVTIRDVATINIPIVVSQDITISDLNVILNVSHTYTSDLVITLTSPAGTTRTLVNRRGGSGDNFSNTTLDDQATSTLLSGRAPFIGAYRPDQSLAAFINQNARGTWTLSVTDRASLDTGRVNAVTLSIAGNPSGQRIRTLSLPDDEVIPPAPTTTAARALAKEQIPVLHGVWVTPDDVATARHIRRGGFLPAPATEAR